MASHTYIRIIAYKVHFNLLHNVLLFLQVEMATSRDILGGICEAQHVTKNADQWCPECGEGLCSDCENHHQITMSSKNHCGISMEYYHKLPTSISEIRYHCEYHGMKYTHFVNIMTNLAVQIVFVQTTKIVLGFCRLEI